MDDQVVCMNCAQPFAKNNNKGYDRYSSTKIIRGTTLTVGDALGRMVGESVTPCGKTGPAPSKRFLCTICFCLLTKLVGAQKTALDCENQFLSRTSEFSYIQRKTGSTPTKRKLGQRTPIKTPRRSKLPKQDVSTTMTPAHITKGFKVQVMKHITNGNYFTAIHLLVRKSQKANGDIARVMIRTIRKELLTYSRSAAIPKQKLTLENMEKFTWNETMEEVESGLPCLSQVLTNIVRPSFRKPVTKLSQVGQLLMTILFTRFPKMFKFFPQWNSLQLFKHGNSHVLEQSFNKLGLCMGVKGTRAIADEMCHESKMLAKSWKSSIEGDADNDANYDPMNETEGRSTDDSWSSSDGQESDDLDDSLMDDSMDFTTSTPADHIPTPPSHIHTPVDGCSLPCPASAIALDTSLRPIPVLAKRCLFNPGSSGETAALSLCSEADTSDSCQ